MLFGDKHVHDYKDGVMGVVKGIASAIGVPHIRIQDDPDVFPEKYDKYPSNLNADLIITANPDTDEFKVSVSSNTEANASIREVKSYTSLERQTSLIYSL